LVAPASIVGVYAMFGVSAFTNTGEESKNAVAKQFIKKMSKGAQAYFLDDSGSRASLRSASKSFPLKSTALTPPAGSCCGSPDNKCAPNPDRWTDPTWVALNFSINEPHHYSYQYIASDDGMSYTARAIGDLDCDGVYGTFEIYGGVKKDVPGGSMNADPANE